MQKYLFQGNIMGNTGPTNVNKGLVCNLSDSFYVIHSKNKILKYLETVVKVMACKVVVVSGLSKMAMYTVKLAKVLKKKSIYIMHGCCELEALYNEWPVDENILKMEKYLLKNVDLILPVSKRYSEIIKQKYSDYEDKIEYIYNGVDKLEQNFDGFNRKKGHIIAVGGDRKLKNNVIVAKAMKKIEENSVLSVYGYIYNPDELPKGTNMKFKGLVSQEQLYRELMQSEIFVLNSIYEPFGLTVFDALKCGCSILVSNVVGALELLDTTEEDIIFNPMDENEIASKIKYLLKNPNNERLISKLDFEKISFKAEAIKLEEFCRKIM